MNILRIDTRSASAVESLAALRGKLAADGEVVSEAGWQKTIEVFGEPLAPQQVVERICRDVRDRGLEAVLDYTAKLDGVELTAETLRVSVDELAATHADIDSDYLELVRRITKQILDFQTAILHRDVTIDLPNGGGWLRQRYVPLARIGCCIPGGAAAYPSSVLMTAVPAQAACVPEIVIIAPPTKYGSYNPDLLATCYELGITEVYRMGGVQAVAALAYGIDGLPRVDKIVGPGNLFVALAKKYVFGTVDIDSIAGPSEVVVIADERTSPAWIASDLIAQAEHSPGASILLSWSESLLDDVALELEKQLACLDRSELARQSLEAFGALVLVKGRREAAELTNEIAPEHLHIECSQAGALAESIHNAGATFIGPLCPVPLGDYVAGPSHVLPTSGTARFASGLSANDFLRAGSMIHVNETGLQQIAEDAIRMARREGLTGHAASVQMRTQ
ncbi:MAG: histidinol dehydrogenase [Pirellulales bacterium]|nr:histidinol dehydrogenase [Pirellulales bacterium]